MKKIIASILVATMLTGCGAPLTVSERDHDGNVVQKEYPTYGLFNESTSKSEKMCYEISVGNVVWSILLIEGVLFPIYFIGWSIYNPVGLKSADGKCGIDSK